MFDQSNCFGFGSKPLKVDFWQAKDDLKQARDEKHVNYVTQLIQFVKSQNNQNRGNYNQ